MYAINLKYKTPMYGAMIGSAIGGCVAGLLKTAIYAFAGASSVIALPLFVSADKPNQSAVYDHLGAGGRRGYFRGHLDPLQARDG